MALSPECERPLLWGPNEERSKSLFDNRKTKHHIGFYMFGNVAVSHPLAGVRGFQKDINGCPSGHKNRVLPYQVAWSFAVYLGNEEALTMEVNSERPINGAHFI